MEARATVHPLADLSAYLDGALGQHERPVRDHNRLIRGFVVDRVPHERRDWLVVLPDDDDSLLQFTRHGHLRIYRNQRDWANSR